MSVPVGNSVPLRFSGPAASLETILPVPVAQASVPVVVAMEDPALRPLAWARILTPGVARIRLKFGRNVPAGSYSGSLRVAGAEYRFVAELSCEVHLRASPPGFTTEGLAGGQTTAEITLVNAGNGDYRVRHAYLFGVFQEGGVDRALGKAYRASAADPRPWIDRVGDNLTASYGGLVRAQVTRGAGVLPPGEVRQLDLVVQFPDHLRRGYTYSGAIEFGNVIYPMRIAVPRVNGHVDNQGEPDVPEPEEAETLL